MIKGEPKKIVGQLSKELILSKVDDYNIYRHYLGEDFDFKKKYHSPFRGGKADNTPNLCFFPHDTGKILFKDFAKGTGGDCFKFVQELSGLNFYQTLEKIDVDFGLNLKSQKDPVFKIQLSKKPDSIHKQSKLIQIIPRDLNPKELAYWEQYQIGEGQLKRNNVHGIDRLFLNKQLIPSRKELRFAYQFDDYLKIYTPYGQEYKWISSCPNDYISNFDNIKYKVFSGRQDKRLIISKSLKDQMILQRFFEDVCSTQNESSSAINDENMQTIIDGYHPDNVYISYDNDDAGREAADYFVTNYGFQTLFTPNLRLPGSTRNVKDWGELVQHHGLEVMENFLVHKKLI